MKKLNIIFSLFGVCFMFPGWMLAQGNINSIYLESNNPLNHILIDEFDSSGITNYEDDVLIYDIPNTITLLVDLVSTENVSVDIYLDTNGDGDFSDETSVHFIGQNTPTTIVSTFDLPESFSPETKLQLQFIKDGNIVEMVTCEVKFLCPPLLVKDPDRDLHEQNCIPVVDLLRIRIERNRPTEYNLDYIQIDEQTVLDLNSNLLIPHVNDDGYLEYLLDVTSLNLMVGQEVDLAVHCTTDTEPYIYGITLEVGCCQEDEIIYEFGDDVPYYTGVREIIKLDGENGESVNDLNNEGILFTDKDVYLQANQYIEILPGVEITPTVNSVGLESTFVAYIENCSEPSSNSSNLVSIPPKGTRPIAFNRFNDAIEKGKIANFQFSVNPNPIVDNSSLSFDLAKQSIVSVEIYSLNGQKIKSLLGSKLMAEGGYQLDLTMSDIPTGSYFLTLNIDTKKYFTKVIKL